MTMNKVADDLLVDNPYDVRLRPRFILGSLITSILLAFAVGRTARFVFIDKPHQDLLLARQALEAAAAQLQRDHPSSSSLLPNNRSSSVGVSPNIAQLPDPVLQQGKVVPKTSYSSKTFDTAQSASINSRWLVPEGGNNKDSAASASDNEEDEVKDVAVDDGDDGDDEDEEPHLPQGQHLLIDIENVDPFFLNSEERLAKAMLDLVNQCGLTLLSYHCHGLEPVGVSCAGVLLESHVAFHTWPTHGVITLDLFTCGPNSLLGIVPVAEKLFAVPDSRTDTDLSEHQPQVIWSHKYRGFNDDDDGGDVAELTDFFNFPIGVRTDYKQEVSQPKVSCVTTSIFLR